MSLKNLVPFFYISIFFSYSIIAAKYLKKLECFCFEQQTFKPGEVVELPLYFAIDEKMPKRIKTVTLSYSFFETVDVSKK